MGVRTDREPFADRGTTPGTPLAALLLEQGQVVPVGRLVDVLQGDGPTCRPSLRRVLQHTDRNETIVTRPPGYVLQSPSGAVIAVPALHARRDDGSCDRAGLPLEKRCFLVARFIAAPPKLWLSPATDGAPRDARGQSANVDAALGRVPVGRPSEPGAGK
jgi:hypothetical protein